MSGSTQAKSNSLTFASGGFLLYTPPTPFSIPKPPNYILLDDENDIFYGVDHVSQMLGNRTDLMSLALHKIKDAAIVFPPNQDQMLNQSNQVRAIGFLVSIEERSSDTFRARKLATVGVQALPTHLMSWAALESLKGPELASELRVGLLRKVFDRRHNATRSMSYVTRKSILDKMSRPWHRDGAYLNFELDSKFGGVSRIGSDQAWEIFV